MKSKLLHLSTGLATLAAATLRTTAPACTATRARASSLLPQGGALFNLPARQRCFPSAADAPPQRRIVFSRALAGKLQTLQSRPLHRLTLERLHSTRAPEVTGATTALIQAERRLPGIYTMLAAPAARERHGHHQEAVAQALAELKALPRADGLDFREVVARELPGLLQKAGFDAGIYAARSSEVGGYGRYLLHSDPDPKERFCLQIFAFEPRQKTPIHNHPNECASYIAQGTLMERLYEHPDAAKAAGHAGWVTKTQKNVRPQASWAGFDSTQLQVPHSLKNHSGSMAVSVHLYRDMDRVSAGQQVAAADKFERFNP